MPLQQQMCLVQLQPTCDCSRRRAINLLYRRVNCRVVTCLYGMKMIRASDSHGLLVANDFAF